MAYILTSKFDGHVPLYRQHEIFERMGADIPDTTLVDWCGRAMRVLQPLIDRIEAGDAKQAQATTEALVRHSWEVVRSVMQAHDPEGLPPAPADEAPARELQSSPVTAHSGNSS